MSNPSSSSPILCILFFRDGDSIIGINGMAMERCDHDILVALLTMSQMVKDGMLEIDIVSVSLQL